MEKNPDWSALPTPALESIMDRLKVMDDYVRFGAVCHAWRSKYDARNDRNTGCTFPPFLLITPPPTGGEVDRQRRALYSLPRKKVYNLQLQVPHDKVCRGSSFGWILTLQRKSNSHVWHDCLVQLQNPFMSRTIDLPPLDNIVQQHPDNSGYSGYYVSKSALSCDPLSSPLDFVVLAIMSRFRGLAFYKPGNTCWASIGGHRWHRVTRSAYMDVIFSPKINGFYVLRNDGLVSVLNFSAGVPGDPKRTEVALPLSHEVCGWSYLVEDLSGQLFLVYRKFYTIQRYHVPGDENTFLYDTSGFRPESPETLNLVFDLFKLDADLRQWNKINSIGDNIMFLGTNDSKMLPSFNCPGCRPNCIYYTNNDDITLGHKYHRHGPPFDGVYSLEDGTVEPHYISSESTETLPQVVWIEPTLLKPK